MVSAGYRKLIGYAVYTWNHCSLLMEEHNYTPFMHQLYLFCFSKRISCTAISFWVYCQHMLLTWCCICVHITYTIVFPDLFQKEEIKSCEEHVKKLLELTPPKGRTFLHKIEHILEREKNWVSTLKNFFFVSLSHKHWFAIYHQEVLFLLFS